MQAKRGTLGLVVVGLMVVFGSTWRTASLRAADTPSERWQNFGMVGIASGQTARLNVVFADPPTPDAPPEACAVQLQFLDIEGVVRANADVRLLPGQARYLDLRKAPIAGGGTRPGADPPDPDRVQLRASWRFGDPPGEHKPFCTRDLFIATVEVIGRDAATTVLYPAPKADPPNPDVPTLR